MTAAFSQCYTAELKGGMLQKGRFIELLAIIEQENDILYMLNCSVLHY